MEIIDKHDRIILQFSSGKDSLCCLYLLKEYWSKIIVCWANPGDEMPETIEVIERVRRTPGINFLEVRPILPQPLSIQLHGLPSDIIPLRNVDDYAFLSQRETSGVSIQSIMQCCNRLLFKPLHDAVIAYGATLVIRGQRLSEDLHSPIRSGDIIDGVEYFFPLEDWSEEQVFNYLEENEIGIPDYYKHVAHSLDCTTCTGFLDSSKDKIAYLKEKHPEKYRVLHERLESLKQSLDIERQHLIDAVNI